MKKVGLRIDVDTFRGTKIGVPTLCKMLKQYDIHASFFFSVGPDNMGRHLFRLLKPSFLWKMLRSNAPGLYGWDIIFKGTFGQGPLIGKKLDYIIKQTMQDKHEIGLHAWDHYSWQTHSDAMTKEQIYQTIKQGFDLLEKITGKPPICSATPGWKSNNKVLIEKNKFPFFYNSDCRGKSIFTPVKTNNIVIGQTQIPVTLPTYDEIIGRDSITDNNYNEHLINLIKKQDLNILTIHAEVEGIAKKLIFEDFLKRIKSEDIQLSTLGEVLKDYEPKESEIYQGKQAGREGLLAIQKL